MNIEDNIRLFFDNEARDHLAITPIQGDASTRRYYRITGTETSTIACHDPQLCASNLHSYPFLILHALFSRRSLPVPEVLAVKAEYGLLLLEDCGTVMLQDFANEPDNEKSAELYRNSIDILADIQSITGDSSQIPFSLSFDHEKLMFEFDFFIEHALFNYFAANFKCSDAGALRREFEAITEILVQPEHFVLNHRDFHSRNIMIHNGKPVLIDFQDARMGLPQYDAVSLIRDSYTDLDDALSEELKTRHYRQLKNRDVITMSDDEYLYLFDLMAFQRSIKALGTFCHQTAVLGKPLYEQSIAPTIAYISDYIASRKELKKAGALLLPLLENGATR